MSQSDFGNLVAPLSGSSFINDKIEPWRDALHSCHSGTSRPSYVAAGMLWIDTTSAPWVLKLYDGSSDVAIGYVNSSTHAFAPAGGPLFSAYLGTNQTLTSGVTTKMNIDTEWYDTASCFDTSAYRFTPNVAGWYQISGNSHCSGTAVNGVYLAIYKNGSAVGWGSGGSFAATIVAAHTSRIVYLNGTTDYVELYAYMASTGTPTLTAASGAQCYFDGHLIAKG